MVEVEPIGGNQELRIVVGLRILVDFGIKLKLGKFWAKIGEKRCSKLRFSTTILLERGLSNRPPLLSP